MIETYPEFVLVHSYMKFLSSEQQNFKALDKIMTGIPIYDNFLSKVDGIGPAIAAIIISEIDITKVDYPEGIFRRAGLDVITIGKYTDENNVEHIIPEYKLLEMMATDQYNEATEELLAFGKYPVTLVKEGRSRKKHAMVPRNYVDREGDSQTCMSLTFNTFLKTKMIGVMGSSFLRGSRVTVNGEKSTKESRKKWRSQIGSTKSFSAYLSM